MKIAILTSSRADYGIYKPLISALNGNPAFQLSIIAFGTHLSPYHGHTIDEIIKDGFNVDYTVKSVLITDDEESISTSIGLTIIKFAEFWNSHAKEFDWVLCLGDRYEMFAAVTAGLSYGVRFAHIHGGETTLGAIDNVFRHCITLASKLHFVATDAFAAKIKSVMGPEANDNNVVVTGALSLDNLQNIRLLTNDEFFDRWNIDLKVPSILVTIHPETVNASQNDLYLQVIEQVIRELVIKYQLIITMPNADTNGSNYREMFVRMGKSFPDKIKLIENFGTQSYFSCMKEVCFMIGNTSSGIIEAASLHKYVINLGDRQKGRLSGNNVFNASYDPAEIMQLVKHIEGLDSQNFDNIYYNGGAANKIVDKLISLG